MAIDRTQVRHVARLARLSLSEADEERYAAQLGHVLDYIEQLNAVDVSGVEPLAFAGDLVEGAGAMRADQAQPGVPRDRALAAAPEHDEHAFVVPRIIE